METLTASVHILVVDDEPDAVKLLELLLKRHGYRTSSAASGEEALVKLLQALQDGDPVQLVLLDLMLPAMDGIAVLKHVRSQPRLSNLLVVVVTAAYSPAQEVAGLEAGADDFIAKPYSTPQLLARIQTLLRTRRAEEALRRAEALSHLLIEGMHDSVFAADSNGRFTYVSPSAVPLTGYTQSELTSGQITLEWLIHPADHERVREQIRATLEDKVAGEIESRVIRKDGSQLWAALTIEPLRDAEGLQGILRDVTARHQAEEALRVRSAELAALNLLAQRIGESLDPQAMLNETLGTLMDAVDAVFGIVYTAEGQHLTRTAWQGLPSHLLPEMDSPDFVRRLSLAHIQVHHTQDDLPPDSEDADILLPIAQAVEAQSWVSLPLRHRSQPMGLVVLASRNPSSFDAAEIDFLAAASEQIGLGLRNAQLYAEAQQRASELALINQVTHTVSSTLNLETVLQAIMSEAVQMFQSEAGSVLLLDEQAEDLVFAVAAGREGKALRGVHVPVASSIAGRAVHEGRPLMVSNAQHDLRLYHQVDQLSGLTTQSVMATPLRVRDRIIGVLEVINKRAGEYTSADLAFLEALAGPAATAIENARLYEAALRHAEEIQRSQEQLIRSEKLAATGRLAVSLAHEMNNPLQAIQNLLFLSLDDLVSESKRREFIQMASEETSRLIAIVQQTLEFYRPAQSQAGPMDINATVERVLALARKKLANNEVQVELRLMPGLPRAQGMPDQIAQVFLNLIVNAAEAMTDGGQLRIASRANGKRLQVVFADTGPGIAPEDLPHIFEPFYTTKSSGTGLGLAVSYGIIESHGGTLSVASVPGHGATFTVQLPALEPPAPTQGRQRKSRKKTRNNP